MQYIDETLAELAKARERFDSVIVSYSGGKDSLAVMDLCVRTFKRVEGFIMEYVPGLALTDVAIAYARDRWKVECRRYIHWDAVLAISQGVFCDSHWTHDIKKYGIADVYREVRKDTGLEMIATGQRRSDSISRARLMKFNRDVVLHPLAAWPTTRHVEGYLIMRGIPIPKGDKATMSGVGLDPSSLCWLHDKHPGDFKKLLEVYPYAEAVIWRRKFYNIPPVVPGAVPDVEDPPLTDEERPV